MAYVLASTTIRNPMNIEEGNSTQYAQQRTLDGSINRDYFGDNKRVWVLDYVNVQPSEYTTIKNIRDTYETTGTAVTWESTETNYTIASTTVHVDLNRRQFNVGGNQYISDFSLILTEA